MCNEIINNEYNNCNSIFENKLQQQFRISEMSTQHTIHTCATGQGPPLSQMNLWLVSLIICFYYKSEVNVLVTDSHKSVIEIFSIYSRELCAL